MLKVYIGLSPHNKEHLSKWYFLFEAYNPLKIYPDRSQILIVGPPVERAITYFPGHGDGILGIVHALLVGETAGLGLRGDDVAPVQDARLEGLYQVEDRQARPDLLVLQPEWFTPSQRSGPRCV